jgi:hypothetical protein
MKEIVVLLFFFAGLAVFLSAASVTIYYLWQALRILRYKYPHTYDDLGRPGLFGGDPEVKRGYSRYPTRHLLSINSTPNPRPSSIARLTWWCGSTCLRASITTKVPSITLIRSMGRLCVRKKRYQRG